MAKCGKQARFYQETATAINKDTVVRFRGDDNVHARSHRKLARKVFLYRKRLIQKIHCAVGNAESATPKYRPELISVQHCARGQGISMHRRGGSRQPLDLNCRCSFDAWFRRAKSKKSLISSHSDYITAMPTRQPIQSRNVGSTRSVR